MLRISKAAVPATEMPVSGGCSHGWSRADKAESVVAYRADWDRALLVEHIYEGGLPFVYPGSWYFAQRTTSLIFHHASAPYTV